MYPSLELTRRDDSSLRRSSSGAYLEQPILGVPSSVDYSQQMPGRLYSTVNLSDISFQPQFPSVSTWTEPPLRTMSDVSQPDEDWLAICRQQQDEQFPGEVHLKNSMGIWEFDPRGREIECYNAYLFRDLIPSTLEERKAPMFVYGYGSISLRVLDDKSSSQYKEMVLYNVKYIHAPQDGNHRIGLGALPITRHLHLPTDQTSTSDGFLSLADGVGCVLGRVSQGYRKLWVLRTFDPPPPAPDQTSVARDELPVYPHSQLTWSQYSPGNLAGGSGTQTSRESKRSRMSSDLELSPRQIVPTKKPKSAPKAQRKPLTNATRSPSRITSIED